MIVRKTPAEVAKIAAAGEIVAECLRELRRHARAGVRTRDLDAIAERLIRARGGRPAFKGYHGYPASICASPNSLVVHGIPDDYELAYGDVLSIDVGVELHGWIADAALTVVVGQASPLARRLIDATRAALYDGIAQARPGNRLGDISHAVQRRVEEAGFSVIRSLVGHGVGRAMHEDPQIPNFGSPGTGPRLEEGMVLAIEPMVNAGGHEVELGADNWAVYSRDGSLAAHFEHTVAVTREGPLVLTPWDDQAPQWLAFTRRDAEAIQPARVSAQAQRE